MDTNTYKHIHYQNSLNSPICDTVYLDFLMKTLYLNDLQLTNLNLNWHFYLSTCGFTWRQNSWKNVKSNLSAFLTFYQKVALYFHTKEKKIILKVVYSNSYKIHLLKYKSEKQIIKQIYSDLSKNHKMSLQMWIKFLYWYQ